MARQRQTEHSLPSNTTKTEAGRPAEVISPAKALADAEIDAEHEIQQEPRSPDQAGVTLANKLRTAAALAQGGSPAKKKASFQDITKQSLLASCNPAMLLGGMAAKKEASSPTKFRSPLAALLIKRGLTQTTSATVAPFIAEPARDPQASEPATSENPAPEEAIASKSPAREVSPKPEEAPAEKVTEQEPVEAVKAAVTDVGPVEEQKETKAQIEVPTSLSPVRQETPSNVVLTSDAKPASSQNREEAAQQQKEDSAGSHHSTGTNTRQESTPSPKKQSLGNGRSRRMGKKQQRAQVVEVSMPFFEDPEEVAAANSSPFAQAAARQSNGPYAGGQGSGNRRNSKGLQGRKSHNGSKHPGARRTELEPYGQTSSGSRKSSAYESSNRNSFQQSGTNRSYSNGYKQTKGQERSNKSQSGNEKVYNNGKGKDQMSYVKYKTTLCRHYQETGMCSLGDACSFAHGDHERRGMNDPMPEMYPGRHYVGAVHSNYKTQVCRNYEQTGVCKFQDNCCFAHGAAELRALTDPLPPIPREVLLYCPPNMKLLPNHGNIQIIPPKNAREAADFNQSNASVLYDCQSPDGSFIQTSQEELMYHQLQQAQLQQQAYIAQQQQQFFAHEPPQPYIDYQQQQQQMFAPAFANFTPPGQDPGYAAARLQQQEVVPNIAPQPQDARTHINFASHPDDGGLLESNGS